jgi:tRNA (guanine-N7-)-methyltransferase
MEVSAVRASPADDDDIKGERKRPREEANHDETENKASEASPLPITTEGEMPQKKFYRSRAHCNPLSHNDTFEYPTQGADKMNWTAPQFYPNHPLLSSSDDQDSPLVLPNVLDIGCGFGGLTIALSALLPDATILGLEIRAKVTEYVRLRIAALRNNHPGEYQNAAVMRSNTMKFMPNLFRKASLDKIFFCFPDPHFKRKNHPRRIVSDRLLSEYAYFLKEETGRLYCITDVEDLHQWHVAKCNAHPMFRPLSEDEMKLDPCVAAMISETEEGKKVERAGTSKYYAVYQRLPTATTVSQTHPIHPGNFFSS